MLKVVFGVYLLPQSRYLTDNHLWIFPANQNNKMRLLQLTNIDSRCDQNFLSPVYSDAILKSYLMPALHTELY